MMRYRLLSVSAQTERSTARTLMKAIDTSESENNASLAVKHDGQAVMRETSSLDGWTKD